MGVTCLARSSCDRAVTKTFHVSPNVASCQPQRLSSVRLRGLERVVLMCVPSRWSHPRPSQRSEHACTVGVASMSRLTSRQSVNAVRRWCLRRRCRRGGVGPRGVDDVSMCFRQLNSSAFSFRSTTNFSFVVVVFFFRATHLDRPL